ncbi:MAG: preprotein translocase subunit SecG [Candidatus Omnitrophica bacterium]|nr:preprotein translocase subunit SecG [Candidatus Omnitrophota bacterium]
MTTLIIVIHVFACVVLITLVLIQRGRGSGLVESFQGVESMFGTKTNAFLTRITTILSVVFFISCLSLAIMSVRQSKSLMANVKVAAPAPEPSAAKAPEPVTPQTQPENNAPVAAQQ